jgi:hypothetical protein
MSPRRVTPEEYAYDRYDELHGLGATVELIAIGDAAGEIMINATLRFGDEAFLSLFEAIIADEDGCAHRRKYSYTGGFPDRIILRYDRDPVVHPDMPEHRHVGERREPWKRVTLADVADEMWDHVRQRAEEAPEEDADEDDGMSGRGRTSLRLLRRVDRPDARLDVGRATGVNRSPRIPHPAATGGERGLRAGLRRAIPAAGRRDRVDDVVVYEVRVTNPDGSESRFELERDEALEVGSGFTQFTMIYRVLRILYDESDRFDAVVEAEKVGGPGQVWRDPEASEPFHAAPRS